MGGKEEWQWILSYFFQYEMLKAWRHTSTNTHACSHNMNADILDFDRNNIKTNKKVQLVYIMFSVDVVEMSVHVRGTTCWGHHKSTHSRAHNTPTAGLGQVQFVATHQRCLTGLYFQWGRVHILIWILKPLPLLNSTERGCDVFRLWQSYRSLSRQWLWFQQKCTSGYVKQHTPENELVRCQTLIPDKESCGFSK